MSWAEWLGKTWQSGPDEASLNLHLWPVDAGCPRQSWSFDLQHMDRDPAPASEEDEVTRWICVEIGALGFHESDWRKWEHFELRADAAWHAATAYTHEYGRLSRGEINVRIWDPGDQPEDTHWVGHDFTLHLGQRAGDQISFELEAWLLPEKTYYREHPETDEELSAFGLGPPQLRVLGIARIDHLNIAVPRCGLDPVPEARKLLREATGLREVYQPRVSWALRKLPGEEDYRPMEGWASTVQFKTQPPDESTPVV